ncbi:MAG TPA: hypothetical protein VHD62_11175 [Opitutaceae bacterium]|nr:hypothetical protein [Opitutaceae bacterium]
MTLADQISAGVERLRAKLSFAPSSTLPERLSAVQAAEAAIQNPAALSDARARISQLEGEMR